MQSITTTRSGTVWVCADAAGLHKIPHYWAGVFVLEARFLYPAQHFALIDKSHFRRQDLLQSGSSAAPMDRPYGVCRTRVSLQLRNWLLPFTEEFIAPVSPFLVPSWPYELL